MQNVPAKFVVERNLNVIYHDPETGMPKIVSIQLFIYIYIYRKSSNKGTNKQWKRDRNTLNLKS